MQRRNTCSRERCILQGVTLGPLPRCEREAGFQCWGLSSSQSLICLPEICFKPTWKPSVKHCKKKQKREREITYCFPIVSFAYNWNHLASNGKANGTSSPRFNSWHCYFDLFPYNSSDAGASKRFYSVQWHFLEEIPSLIKWRNISSNQHKALCP